MFADERQQLRGQASGPQQRRAGRCALLDVRSLGSVPRRLGRLGVSTVSLAPFVLDA
jgi:hypothetical protein